MKKCATLLAATSLVVAAMLPSTNLLAQKTGSRPVTIDGVRYVPETLQASAGSQAAPIMTPGASAPHERSRNGNLGFGIGDYILDIDGGESESHVGVWFGGGFTAFPSSIGQVRFNFSLGIYYYDESFASTSVNHGYYYNRYANWDRAKWDVAMPLLANASYEFNLGSTHWRARAGIVLGETMFVRNNGSGDTDVAESFSYGVDLGVTWTPGRSFYLDGSCRIIDNTQVTFRSEYYIGYNMKSTAYQLNTSIGWRF